MDPNLACQMLLDLARRGMWNLDTGILGAKALGSGGTGCASESSDLRNA